MTIDLNWITALLGCAALFAVWRFRFQRAGWRGFFLVLMGATIILSAAYSAGLGIALTLAAAMLACLYGLMRARHRRRPRYQAPNEISGRCSQCGRSGQVRRCLLGWLCENCRIGAAIAGKNL